MLSAWRRFPARSRSMPRATNVLTAGVNRLVFMICDLILPGFTGPSTSIPLTSFVSSALRMTGDGLGNGG